MLAHGLAKPFLLYSLPVKSQVVGVAPPAEASVSFSPLERTLSQKPKQTVHGQQKRLQSYIVDDWHYDINEA